MESRLYGRNRQLPLRRAGETDPVNFWDPRGLNRAAPICYFGPTWEDEYGYGWSMMTCDGYGDGGGGGGGSIELPDESAGGQQVPQNKGGWNTNPKGAVKIGWQYLTSIWKPCLDFFNGISGFDTKHFRRLLQGGIKWLDTRDPAVGSRSVDSIIHNGDATTLRNHVGPSDATGLGFTRNIALGVNWFTDNTQNQQIASTIHEALHIELAVGDAVLKGMLMNFGFKPEAYGSGDITDWLSRGCR